ncbi:DUF397 domain-containing protein [Yinghuangia sp. YIM S09857]|uniref:DUF397 domain-containing protein n=1 Tax=Yinghuangia sp. YIM S09857 TaxID=3436929 RepID=UPI003F5334F8
MVWIKSSYSGNADNACVEVACAAELGVVARDSKRPDGPRLSFGGGVWADFLSGFQAHSEPVSGYTPRI